MEIKLQKFRVLVLCLGIAQCTPPPTRHITPAFYHWQTTLQLDASERVYLDLFQCKKLYIKILDVSKDPASDAIIPLSRLAVYDTAGLGNRILIPVIFITNAVFKDITAAQTDELVAHILAARQDVLRHWPARSGREALQFDCDWTQTTRDAYFIFLQKVKIALPEIELSATIRLHQYKFPAQTGVPPVDRGMLMFYNTGDIDNPAAGNSIFQPAEARKYLVGAPEHYTLPLDLVLPVFSWTLVYRDDDLWKIIPDLPPAELRDTARFQVISRDRFGIRRGTFLAGHYLRPGDVLRQESISPELLREAAQIAATADLATDATVAFFYLDTTILRRYPVQQLQNVCASLTLPVAQK